MKEIKITDINNIRIGQYEDNEAATGCTVFICENSMPAGVDVRGGGPASRDTDLIGPLAADHPVHGIVLSGGSAFGLGTAGGVMKYLEAMGVGYDVGGIRVPLVVQSDIFDLGIGEGSIRPNEEMGYKAAVNAFETPNYRDGNYGVGCGASIGKINGMKTAMKSGIGSYAVEVGELQIGAVSVVNAWGDVYDWRNGEKIGGLLNSDATAFVSTEEEMRRSLEKKDAGISENTTLSVVITNSIFSQAELCKIAGMAHNGYGRSIRPVHTSLDGDTIYAVSVGEVVADKNLVGTLAAEVVSEAITRAVLNAETAYGLIAAKDLEF